MSFQTNVNLHGTANHFRSAKSSPYTCQTAIRPKKILPLKIVSVDKPLFKGCWSHKCPTTDPKWTTEERYYIAQRESEMYFPVETRMTRSGELLVRMEIVTQLCGRSRRNDPYDSLVTCTKIVTTFYNVFLTY